VFRFECSLDQKVWKHAGKGDKAYRGEFSESVLCGALHEK